MDNIKDVLIFNLWMMFPECKNDTINLIANRIITLFSNKKQSLNDLFYFAKTTIEVFVGTDVYKKNESSELIGLFVPFVVKQVEKINDLIDSVEEFENIENKNQFSIDLLNIFHTASYFDTNINICKTSFILIDCLETVNNQRSD